MTEGLPEAETKLRLVLDYLPCEACLSQPVKDQDLLCSVCHRLDRDVEVTRATRTLVLLERPSPVAPPVALVSPPLPPPSETPVPAPAEAEPAPLPVVEATPPPMEAVPAQAEAPPEEPPQPKRPFSLFRRRKTEEEKPAEAAEEPERVEPTPAEAAPAEAAPAEAVPEPAPVEAMPAPVEETPVVAAEPVKEPEPAAAESPAEPARKRGFSLFRRKKAEEEKPAEAEPAKEDAFEDSFDYVRPAEAPRAEAREPEPDEDDVFSFTRSDPVAREERPPEPLAPPVQDLEDDFLYRPPGERAAPEPAEAAPAWADEPPADLLPREEVPVEPAGDNPWAPPADRESSFQEPVQETPESLWPEEPADREPMAPEETFVEMEVLPDEPEPAPVVEEVVETEIVEMEVVEDEPEPAATAPPVAPEPPAREETPARRGGFGALFRRRRDEAPAPEAAYAPPGEAPPHDDERALTEPFPEPAAPDEPDTDLVRLQGFGAHHRAALARHGVESISHLSGHDPVELAERAGLDDSALAPWIHVADLVQEVGIPLDSALALVAAGVEGPRALREADADAIAQRVAETGGGPVSARDVRRWKRRA